MSMDDQLRKAVRQLAGTELTDEVYLLPCTVDDVDLDNLTCDCTAVGGVAVTDVPNVALCAEVDDGFVQVPAVGSVVLVIMSKRQKPFVAMYSELSTVLLNIGTGSAITVDKDLIKLNGGEFGGLIKIADLVDKLNNLENLVNSLIAKYNAHVHTANNTPTISTESGTLTPTQREELENTTIIHGEHGE
jgi:hypothetical protein